MTNRTVYTCDRPGCTATSNGPMKKTLVWIREPPVADLAQYPWDLCGTCFAELDHARVVADLDFGDKWREKKKPVELAKPPEPSEWAKRVAKVREDILAKQAAQKASWGPPKRPPMLAADVTSETVLEGKTVAAWHEEMEALAEATPKGNILDLTHYPGWVTWAVSAWISNGKPTPSTKVLAEITQMREKAEDLVKFADLDKNKATNLDEEKAKKLLKAAQKKKDKAAELFQEADKIAKKHKK